MIRVAELLAASMAELLTGSAVARSSRDDLGFTTVRRIAAMFDAAGRSASRRGARDRSGSATD